MPVLAILSYLGVAALVIYFSIMLSNYVDLLDKKTNLSGAFLGGILLAAVTSLPELFTSITAAIFIKDNHYVLGNILGSNLFNVCLFFIIFVCFFKKFISSKVSKSHIYSLVFIAISYALVTIASFVFDFNKILWGWFNPISILILIVYGVSIAVTPKEEVPEGEEEIKSKLTVKQIVILFLIFSILLIGASVLMTYVVDWVSKTFNIGSTFGGALFLGVATSLPELTATIQLCRKKNFNAAFGNILGSCVFNYSILSICDILSFNVKASDGSYLGLYRIDQSSFLLIIFGVFSLIVVTFTIVAKVLNRAKDNCKFRIFYLICGSLLVASYVAFLILSNINLNIPFAPMVA